MICKVFRHSPIFRIGGDEFAIILRNSDYDDVEALIKQFDENMMKLVSGENLKPWEKITAAVGYAVFDPEKDHCVEDVFRRADAAMYEKKVQMKTEGRV